MKTTLAVVLLAIGGASTSAVRAQAQIVHDAEYCILEMQNGEAWRVEDDQLDARLADLRSKHGAPPNIVYILWDDMAFGDAGIPEINKIRGFDTPNCNRMADEGICFTRMYAEPSCTTNSRRFDHRSATLSKRNVHSRIPRRVRRAGR